MRTTTGSNKEHNKFDTGPRLTIRSIEDYQEAHAEVHQKGYTLRSTMGLVAEVHQKGYTLRSTKVLLHCAAAIFSFAARRLAALRARTRIFVDRIASESRSMALVIVWMVLGRCKRRPSSATEAAILRNARRPYCEWFPLVRKSSRQCFHTRKSGYYKHTPMFLLRNRI